MRVELIHPPHGNATDDRLDAPLGLLSIAAHLRKVVPGVEVRVNDLSGGIPFESEGADFYGITSYATSMNLARELTESIHTQFPKARVVVGGANPSAIPEQYQFADYVVVGEGEEAMARILRNEAKGIVYTEHLQDNWDFPAFDLVDLKSYHRTIDGQPSMSLLTTRGCPYRCAFCGLHQYHSVNGVRYRKLENVIEDVETVIKDYGIRAINFQDDCFTLDEQRISSLLGKLKPLGIIFRCHGRVGLDTEETYKMLAEAGCRQLRLGIESGSQKILDRMQKGVTVRQNRQAIQWGKKHGMVVRVNFILGFPGETAATIEETKRFIEETDPDQYFVSNFVPFPGTPVWDHPRRFGITKMSRDLDQYFQIGKDGTGGLIIDTVWLSREDFRGLELDFRSWLKSRPMRGPLLEYERN